MEKIIEETLVDKEQFSLYQLKVQEDDFTYLLEQNGVCLAIDPSDLKEVELSIDLIGCCLEAILITHFHKKHNFCASALKEESKAPILGPKNSNYLDSELADGDCISLGPFSMEIMHLSANSNEHIMYFFRELKLLFCGDLLSIGGCGKILEEDQLQYFQVLEKIKSLPKDTRILSASNLGKKNAEFNLSLDPNYPQAKQLQEDCFATIETEIGRNPFLMAKNLDDFKILYQEKLKL
jgi:hydroxyacylglutathione hydrolase